MGSVLIQLLPLVIGSMAMPSWALRVFALLSSGHGRGEATALVGGVTSVRLCQGIVFGTVLSAYEISHGISALEAIVSTVLTIVGILMWVIAVRPLFQKDELNLMNIAGALTPVRALGLGALLVVTSSRGWIFTLAALGIIDQAGLDIAQNVGAYLLYVHRSGGAAHCSHPFVGASVGTH